MESFTAGAIVFGYIVVGVFFLRFWRRTRDSLFAIFALAFFVLAANGTIVTLSGIEREALSWVYLIRAAAFMLIIAAIVRKNLPRRGS